MMQIARYGRPAVGRCAPKNYGYVGCSINVLHYMDTLCSGRRECKFEVPTHELKVRKPCPRDLASYIEASFVCVPGK